MSPFWGFQFNSFQNKTTFFCLSPVERFFFFFLLLHSKENGKEFVMEKTALNHSIPTIFFVRCKPRNVGLCMVLGVHPTVYPVMHQRYTVHERALYFKSIFFFLCRPQQRGVYVPPSLFIFLANYYERNQQKGRGEKMGRWKEEKNHISKKKRNVLFPTSLFFSLLQFK